MSSFGETLAHFKKTESAESITPLLEDAELRAAIVAWQSVRIHYDHIEQCDATNENEKWDWLWSMVKFDANKFAVVAGIKKHEANNMIVRLMGLKLIYPDGTIHNLAKQYLNAIIISKIPKKK